MFNQYFDLESILATASRLHNLYNRYTQPKEGTWQSPPTQREKSDLQKFATTVDYEIVQE